MFKKVAKLSKIAFSIVAISAICASNASAEISEGKTVARVRLQGLFTQSKQKFSPAIGTTNVTKTDKLLQNGIGGEVGATYFITDNIGAEFAVGLASYKVKQNLSVGSATAANNYNQVTSTPTNKSKRSYLVPVTAIVQYHPMITNEFSPYIGVGLHYHLVASSSKIAKLSNIYGPVIQAGFDIWDKDDMTFNVDVKQFFTTSATAKYKNVVSSGNNAPLKSKVKFNPLVISGGVGWAF